MKELTEKVAKRLYTFAKQNDPNMASWENLWDGAWFKRKYSKVADDIIEIVIKELGKR